MQQDHCVHFNIFHHCLEWNIARIIWIAWHKNIKNKNCFFNTLSKDVVKLILTFVGKQFIPQEVAHKNYLKF